MGKVYSVVGEIFWCKALGDTVPDYNDEPHWCFDLNLDDKGVEQLTKLGLKSGPKEKIKSRKDNEDQKYIVFSRREFKKADGSENEPIEFTLNGKDWPDDITHIGNGTEAKVKFSLYTSTYKGKTYPGVAVLSVDVTKIVEYTPPERKKRVKKEKKEDWSEENGDE